MTMIMMECAYVAFMHTHDFDVADFVGHNVPFIDGF
jgi:hypothetical protein